MISEQLDKIKIIPVLVLNDLDEGLKVCEALCSNGLPAAEITFRTAAAESVIREAVKRFLSADNVSFYGHRAKKFQILRNRKQKRISLPNSPIHIHVTNQIHSFTLYGNGYVANLLVSFVIE